MKPKSKCDQGAAYLPDAEQIAAACEKVRRGWSGLEAQRRQLRVPGCPGQAPKLLPPAWTLPVVHIDAEIAAALNQQR